MAEVVTKETATGNAPQWRRIQNVRYGGGNQYVFFRVTQSGEEEADDSAWTAPVWLEVGGPAPTPTIAPNGNASFVASRFSDVYHVSLACKDAQRIKTANRISGSAAAVDRTLHSGCPRQ